MPIRPVEYVPRPYVRGGAIGDMIRLRGRNAADAELRQGDIAAQLWSNLGNQINQAIGGYMQQRNEAPIRARQASLADLELQDAERVADERARVPRQDAAFTALLEQQPNPDPREVMAIYGPQRGMAIAQGLSAFQELASKKVTDAQQTAGRLAIGVKSLSPPMQAHFWPAIRQAAIAGGLGDEQAIPEQPVPEFLDAVIGWASGKQPEQPQGFTLSPGQQRFGPDGQPIASVPEPMKAPEPFTLGEGQIRYGADGQPIARGPAKRDPQGSDDPGPLETIIGPDGKPIRVARKDAVGKTPASGTLKPASGLEKRALNFFNRAAQADRDLEALEPAIQAMGLGGQARLAIAPNLLQSQEGQSYLAAQRAFTEARLRKDSGAAIPPHEFESDRQTYFAQPGDSKETLEQKRRARAAILASLAFESGQALGEYVGDADEARAMVEGYRERSARKDDAGGEQTPNLSNLREGMEREFRNGPFKGQVWSVVNGNAVRIR